MLYAAAASEPAARVALLHAGAGIRAQSYEPFARFLAQAGIPTLAYDYRGIGLSRPAALRGGADSRHRTLDRHIAHGRCGQCERAGVPRPDRRAYRVLGRLPRALSR